MNEAKASNDLSMPSLTLPVFRPAGLSGRAMHSLLRCEKRGSAAPGCANQPSWTALPADGAASLLPPNGFGPLSPLPATVSLLVLWGGPAEGEPVDVARAGAKVGPSEQQHSAGEHRLPV